MIRKSKMGRNMEYPSAQALFSGAGSIIATAFFLRSLARDFIPYEIQQLIWAKLYSLFSSFSSNITIIIDELEGFQDNHLYQAAEVYLGTKLSPDSPSFRAFIPSKETKITFSIGENREVVDVFNGIPFTWRKVHKRERESNARSYDRDSGRSTNITISYFKLSFHKKHRDMVFNSYLPYVVSQSAKFKEESRTLKIHTLLDDDSYGRGRQRWTSVNLDHPATFETMAMDSDMKKMIMEDLERFVRRKEFYRRVGKAWKRRYLLFGPPGTGKSSLIAAIANYLNFDIYDLELTDLKRNSELQKILIATANRSILVVEDIDCSIDLERKKKAKEEPSKPGKEEKAEKQQITLSGLLNFIDGLWSSCGDERIIIFTTNHKERLDPALLRPGRMDVHLHLSYCTPCGFKMLASIYWGITDDPLFIDVEKILPVAKVTPAEVAEQLLKSENPESALKGLLEFLKVKRDENHLKATTIEMGSQNGEIVKLEKVDNNGESRINEVETRD